MRMESCGIEGVSVFELDEFSDRRGSFFEAFRREWLPGVFRNRLQVNCSRSAAGVLRGMHYHEKQWDLWVPVEGKMRAGLADLRKDSPTGGTSLALPMEEDGPRGLLIPPGVAHGFAAITDVILIYVVNNYYDGSDEYGIAWDDPGLNIDWGLEDPILSARDMRNPTHDWNG